MGAVGCFEISTMGAEGCFEAPLGMTAIGQLLEGLQRKSPGEEVEGKPRLAWY